MGPLFFRAENKRTRWHGDSCDDASMGPLFFRAENVPLAVPCVALDLASMGPLFFRAENSAALGEHQGGLQSFNGAALFQSGEPSLIAAVRYWDSELQWGRSFSERRTSSTKFSKRARIELQWGRSFSERRTS